MRRPRVLPAHARSEVATEGSEIAPAATATAVRPRSTPSRIVSAAVCRAISRTRLRVAPRVRAAWLHVMPGTATVLEGISMVARRTPQHRLPTVAAVAAPAARSRRMRARAAVVDVTGGARARAREHAARAPVASIRRAISCGAEAARTPVISCDRIGARPINAAAERILPAWAPFAAWPDPACKAQRACSLFFRFPVSAVLAEDCRRFQILRAGRVAMVPVGLGVVAARSLSAHHRDLDRHRLRRSDLARTRPSIAPR